MNAAIALGYPTVTMQNVSGILYTMLREGLVKRPVFGFYFERPESLLNVTGAYGELTLGGSDPSHFVGQLSYVPVDSEALWQFKMDGVKTGEQTFEYRSRGCEVVLLSSISVFIVPDGDKLNQQLGATLQEGLYWIFNCNDFSFGSLPNVTLTIDGKDYTVSPGQYAYEIEIGGIKLCPSLNNTLTTGPFKNKWLLGTCSIFMARYYTEFDAANVLDLPWQNVTSTDTCGSTHR